MGAFRTKNQRPEVNYPLLYLGSRKHGQPCRNMTGLKGYKLKGLTERETQQRKSICLDLSWPFCAVFFPPRYAAGSSLKQESYDLLSEKEGQIISLRPAPKQKGRNLSNIFRHYGLLCRKQALVAMICLGEEKF